MEINILMMMGMVFFQNKRFKSIQWKISKDIYTNWYYVLENDYIKDTRIGTTYSLRKGRATGYVDLNGSPYCDAEGSLQIRSCLHGAMINAPLIIGEKSTNWNCIDSVHLEEWRTHTWQSWKNANVYHL